MVTKLLDKGERGYIAHTKFHKLVGIIRTQTFSKKTLQNFIYETHRRFDLKNIQKY